MKKEEFFGEWKGDWNERKEEFHTNQAELFRHIRDKVVFLLAQVFFL